MQTLRTLSARGAIAAVVALLLLAAAACGGSDTATGEATASVAAGAEQSDQAQTPVEDPDADADADADDDHADDHGDEDHGDDHGDDDHGDEDHDDDDHDDDDHGDDHGDDDHGDEDHDDDDHDDDDHDDHDDEDHDDHDHEESSSGLGAHVHGAADLFVAWSGNDVVVDLVSPSNNVFGFEYEPTSDEDLAIVKERTQVLTAPGTIALNDEAGCTLATDVEIETAFEGSHAEVTASWLFVCENPGELTQLDTTALFDEFPGFEDIDAQWASDTGQSAVELTPSSTILRFE